MTPAQIKAKELVDRFKNILPRMDYQLLNEISEQSAIQAIDFMLEQCEPTTYDETYWQSVKQAINEL